MPNVKISAATDIGTPLASDMLPLARSGDTNAYHVTMAEISAFSSTSVASGAYGNIGRNLLHNAQFLVTQRGMATWTTNTYMADRWAASVVSDTISITVSPLSDANRASIGDEAALQGLLNVFTGNAAAGAYNNIYQRIESVRRLANKSVTVSFWAWAASGTPKLGVSVDQNMGTGGSPSAGVQGTGQAVTLSTTPARYSVTLAIASLSGKTLGTNGDDNTQLNIWYSSGATNNTRAGGIGVQSSAGGIALWGVQLEVGTVATPLSKPDPRYDLANCQRFYQIGTVQYYGYATSGASLAISQAMPVRLRATPVVTPSFTLTTGTTGANVTAFDAQTLSLSATATGPFTLQATYTASADL